MVVQEYAKNGYVVLDRNVRIHGFRQIGEIDIIATKNKVIVFVEVKTRRSETFGSASEAVNFFKQRKLIHAAKMFLQKNLQYQDWDWRFDVAEVYIDKKENPVIILENVIEDMN